MKKTNGDLLISGILELVKIKRKELNDKIYLNVQIIKALRKSQDNSNNTIVKNVIQDNITKLCNENDTLSLELLNFIKPLKSLWDQGETRRKPCMVIKTER